MKSSIIICATALAVGTLASDTAQLNVHDVEYLIARAIDPKTMDPTRLSVLSVMRTAIPLGTAFPTPTGDVKSDWYQKLPEDVKSLLPLLYPATPEAPASSSVPVSSSSAASVSVSASASTPPSEMTSSEVSIAASASSSLPPGIPSLTVTKTLLYSPSATAGDRVLTNGSSSASTRANGTLATASPSPSGYLSAGTRTAMNMETLAALAWIGLGAGFLMFA